MTTLNRGTRSYRDCCLRNICSAFPSPSDCKGSQKMKPSVMAHFQGFTNRSVAGHRIMLQERVEHPQPFAGHWGWQWLRGSWGPLGEKETRCPGLWLFWGMRTGPQPPNPQVIWCSLTFCQQVLPQASLLNCRKEVGRDLRGCAAQPLLVGPTPSMLLLRCWHNLT